MAMSSLLTSRNYKFNVFSSFHGPDVRKTLLSHMREQFKRNGITMFEDQEIERSAVITPSLIEAIRGSRISIVILSMQYASSSWCLDELVEILDCKKTMGQIVMTIFYGVDPSDIRKQTGVFRIAFNETCARKTDEERQKWSKALTDVGNIAGEDFFRWDNEALMIKKIARDVSDKLNATPSRDFDGMVGLKTHLREMQSLLHWDYEDGALIVGICGPAGIGKTTIARALYSRLSSSFQLTCFMDNLRVSYHNGLDEYGLKLCLQEKLLSKILNQTGVSISHLGVIKERLHDQRVLIILDDVNSIKQLEALADETTWFGPGSRILVTTENKDLLQQHGINNTYNVRFPSRKEALQILWRYSSKQSYPHDCFEFFAERITKLCCKLPLALRVVGSYLRGKTVNEWQEVINRLDTIIDRDIEDVLRVGYEGLEENEKSLFLYIAIFFNYEAGDIVKAMFDNTKVDVKRGLKILVDRSLIEISKYGEKIEMHRLLQQVGIKAIHNQEPWKRQILIDNDEIFDVLELAKGTRAVSGISLDTSTIKELIVCERAFKRMSNLRFLKVYNSSYDRYVHIPGEMEFPRRLRLLDWVAYPCKSLPRTFCPQYLVKLRIIHSKLEYLWQGTQPLANLKKMYLRECYYLRKLPDLSNARNLEKLDLMDCRSLVEIPSSCSHLHKLQDLDMSNCIQLQVIPAHMNLASLEYVTMMGCYRLRHIPVISTNIKRLLITETRIKDLPSIQHWSRLKRLTICNLKEITHFPTSLTHLDLSHSDIERIPDCIIYLHRLQYLFLLRCRRLTSLPELPSSPINLLAEDCESLETVFYPLKTSHVQLFFNNCFKLGAQVRAEVIRQSITNWDACLPGREVPREFDHRARGNSLTIPLNGIRYLSPYTRFSVCLVVLPKDKVEGNSGLILCTLAKDDSTSLRRRCSYPHVEQNICLYFTVALASFLKNVLK